MYAHLPIEGRQIRLLELLPASLAMDSDPVCRLKVIDLDDDNAPTYEALSYTWKATDTEEDGDIKHQYIILNDACLYIRPNLWDALKALERPHSRMLWVDALCINQDDEEEKSRQVLFMAQIYRQARSVIVWLGLTFDMPVDDGTRQDAAGVFRSCLYRIITISNCFILPATVETNPSIPFGGDRLCQLSEHHIFALFCWMNSLYWRRIWVVQELVSARHLTVQLGTLPIPWDLIRKAASRVAVHLSSACCRSILWERTHADAIAYKYLKQFARTISDIEDTRAICAAGSNLETQLRLHSGRLASRPHDIVYALMGLVTNWGAGRPIEPDYGFEPRIVLCDAVRHIIDSYTSLSILCGDYNREGVLDKYNPNITTLELLDPPSWALCFAASSQDISVHGEFFSSPRLSHLDLYNASQDTKPSIQRTKKREILRIEGFYFDRVAVCANTRLKAGADGDVYMSSNRILLLENNAEQVLEWFKLSRNSFERSDYHATGESWTQAFSRTTHCDVIFQNGTYTRSDLRFGSANSSPATDTSCQKIMDKLPSEEKTVIPDYAEERNGQREYDLVSATSHPAIHQSSVQKCTDIEQDYGPFALNRDFFITERGYLGVGPASMVPGDVIAVLFGGTVPFVLRPAGHDRPGQYQLLGDCYCHGIMDGEAMTGDSTKRTWFELV